MYNSVKHTEKKMPGQKFASPGAGLTNIFTYSFYASRSQKFKKTIMYSILLGKLLIVIYRCKYSINLSFDFYENLLKTKSSALLFFKVAIK